jgi:arylformamidase
MKAQPSDFAGSAGRLIDISARMSTETAVGSQSPAFLARRVLDLERQDPCNVSILWLGSHCGTHVNAPAHVLVSGEPIDRMPLEATVGAARVVRHLGAGPITPTDVEGWNVQRGERLLIRTRQSDWDPSSAAFLGSQAAELLASQRPRVIGIDRPSIGDERDRQMLTHRALLAREVWIIEGLELGEVEPGRYELICLPLKLLNGDAAPARALLRTLPPKLEGP